jgi:hypothetical protein
MHGREHDVAVVGSELLVPVSGVAGAAESVDGHAGHGQWIGPAGGDALHGAQDLSDAV